MCKFELDKFALPVDQPADRSMAKVTCAKINCHKIEAEKMHLCGMPFFDDFHSFEGVICWKFA